MLFFFLFSKYMTLHFDLHVTMEKNKFLFSLFTKILWNALKLWKNNWCQSQNLIFSGIDFRYIAFQVLLRLILSQTRLYDNIREQLKGYC